MEQIIGLYPTICQWVFSHFVAAHMLGKIPNMGIKERIVQRMQEMNLKSATLSKLAGLNQTYVRDLLSSDDPNPRIRHLTALADALEVSVEWLLDGAESEQESEITDLWEHKLDKQARQAVLDFARFKASQSD